MKGEGDVPKIDQQTRRRMGCTGLTALDFERVCPGYTLYTPMFGDGTVYLLDLEGNEVHTWNLPHPPGLWGYILPNGNLFYMAKIKDETWERFPAWKIFKGGLLLEVDWDGGIVWEHHDKEQHHDARRTPTGGAMYLTLEPVPEELITSIRGGIHVPGHAKMWADRIVEVDATGKTIWEWHAYEHLSFEEDIITPTDLREEWSHGNTVVPLDGDRVLVSFRNISTVGIIDKGTGRFLWKLGWDVLAQQHDPSLLPNGNILIFNNGTRRRSHPLVFSEIIEVDPATNKTIWHYRDSPFYNFYSPYISGVQRLPNGNTLITEGNHGRIFEVTSDGQVVWEYINPYFFDAPIFDLNNAVFRARRYLPEEVTAVLHATCGK
ncbi:MAG: arylsulfotransferase family protein [Thermodesulfobacteriota bacterium]|nr:arylsulfotransferase family protein [Thermodesulfobacteriota bacterium]